ncbi:MAG: bifunctional homocysteine S-methyltransferase/methylenetetrahydrofolate reductase [Lachnospiraceae bacterium]|nr:bifunctional homocysteine S-methyltransferase/methylenetetrahydrofolate reductase [Lachnospiraceae bacterium]
MTIRDYLKDFVLIMDGAMGTYYDLLYHGEELMAEEANLTHPERILNIHKEYIKKGAKLIRTNTFALNKPTLIQMNQRGLETEEYIKKNLSEAVRLAKEAVRDSKEEVFIGADIGPIAEREEDGEEDAEYRRLVDLFIEEGIDIFVLETFPDTASVKRIASYIKEKKPDAFVIGQFAVNPTGYSQMGHSVKRLMAEAGRMEELDCCGLNCGIGVAHMSRFFKQTDLPAGKYISALPNCGYPHVVRGRTIYSDSASYYGERMEQIVLLGTNIVGGCCGTTPAYIEELSRRFFECRPVKRKENKNIYAQSREKRYPFPFIEKMERGEKTVVVELDPPFDEDNTKLMEGAFYLKEKGIDAVTIADSPMARSRADSFLVASKLIRDVGISVIPHVTCRDRNRIGLRSTILGGYLNDIRNVLVVTGDPVDRAERDITKSVFDFNSIRLMEFIEGMNGEHFEKEPICIGGALNQNASSLTAVAARMEKKKQAGASFFLTQPIYDEEGARRIRQLKEQVDTKILCGIMPLVSYRNASFIQNEMPGIYVPDEIVSCYHPDMSKEEAEDTAVRISVDIMKMLEEIADGYYFMTPFNRVRLIGRIIEEGNRIKKSDDKR